MLRATNANNLNNRSDRALVVFPVPGSAPWHKPWKARRRNGLPRNLITGHVRKGEAGLPVVYWKFGTHEVQDGDQIIEKPSVLCRYFTVFNTEQCEGLNFEPLTPDDSQPQLEPIAACEQVVSGWFGKPVISHGGNRASYNKLADLIQMPERMSFGSREEYYSTLYHELMHSTGHPTRLNRATLMDFERFGDQNYGREELVAEMGAAFLCGVTGIENKTIDNSGAYLQSWLEALKADSRLVLVAAGRAQKAVDYILGTILHPLSTVPMHVQ
jgi:antirestriction protein ArdC